MAINISFNPIDWTTHSGQYGTTPKDQPTAGSVIAGGNLEQYAQPNGQVTQPGYNRPQISHDRDSVRIGERPAPTAVKAHHVRKAVYNPGLHRLHQRSSVAQVLPGLDKQAVWA